MTGINIALFDHDWHNALYYFILNGDEQIYLRYGGRDETAAEAYLDLDSFALALKLGLEQHAKYRAGELPKQPKPEPRYPRDNPLLKQEVLDAGRCVECHLIADYRLLKEEEDGTLDKLRDMFVYPDIKRIGIQLDIPKGLVVKEAGGASAAAGLQAGDLIRSLNGTPVLTFGDLQQEYNKVPKDASEVTLGVERDSGHADLTVALPDEWWVTDLYHRYWTVDPKPFFTSRPLTAEEKQALGLPEDGLAAEVETVDTAAQVYNLHDLKPGDIIVSVNGKQRDDSTQDLDVYIKLNVDAGDSFTVEFLRDGKRSEMRVRTFRENFRKPEI